MSNIVTFAKEDTAVEIEVTMTLEELKRAVDFAENNGSGKFKAIEVCFSKNCGLGRCPYVKEQRSDEYICILEVDAI